MNLKLITLLVLITLPLMALAGDVTDSAAKADSVEKQDHSKVDAVQIKQKKLENLFRRLVNRCEPFPKCL